MKNLLLISLLLCIASCAKQKFEKSSLEYKTSQNVADYKYDFDLAITNVIDKRTAKFVLNNDNYFDDYITKSIANITFNKVRNSNAFNTVKIVDEDLSFNPTSTQIQEIRRKYGQDAILLTRVNQFNINVRQLSDNDESNFVNIKMFTNISYKIILTDSETIIFLTTKDTSKEKVIEVNDKAYKTINKMAITSLKENILSSQKEFIQSTKVDFKEKELKVINKINTLEIKK